STDLRPPLVLMLMLTLGAMLSMIYDSREGPTELTEIGKMRYILEKFMTEKPGAITVIFVAFVVISAIIIGIRLYVGQLSFGNIDLWALLGVLGPLAIGLIATLPLLLAAVLSDGLLRIWRRLRSKPPGVEEPDENPDMVISL